MHIIINKVHQELGSTIRMNEIDYTIVELGIHRMTTPHLTVQLSKPHPDPTTTLYVQATRVNVQATFKRPDQIEFRADFRNNKGMVEYAVLEEIRLPDPLPQLQQHVYEVLRIEDGIDESVYECTHLGKDLKILGIPCNAIADNEKCTIYIVYNPNHGGLDITVCSATEEVFSEVYDNEYPESLKYLEELWIN